MMLRVVMRVMVFSFAQELHAVRFDGFEIGCYDGGV